MIKKNLTDTMFSTTIYESCRFGSRRGTASKVRFTSSAGPQSRPGTDRRLPKRIKGFLLVPNVVAPLCIFWVLVADCDAKAPGHRNGPREITSETFFSSRSAVRLSPATAHSRENFGHEVGEVNSTVSGRKAVVTSLPGPTSAGADEKPQFGPVGRSRKEVNGGDPSKPAKTDSDDDPYSATEGFHWKPAIMQSLQFHAVQHGVRLFQRKTYTELGGKFFDDWIRSVENVRGRRDGDDTFTNYVGYPLQGSHSGRIFVNNSDNARRQEFGASQTEPKDFSEQETHL